MKVKEVADLVGISVRTLHYYDEIGLLKPSSTTEAGYRIYSQEDLALLQQILFFRELDFPLKQIKDIIHRPDFDQLEALHIHRHYLLKKRQRLDQILKTLDKTIKHMKGEINMTEQEKFKGFDFSKNPYEKEARERWGDQAVDESQAKLKEMTNEEKQKLADEFDTLYKQLAAIRHLNADSAEAQKLIQTWYDYINRFGHYSLEAFKGLGQMYVDDERFKKNIDQYGEGLAEFMRDAMAVYAEQHGSKQ